MKKSSPILKASVLALATACATITVHAQEPDAGFQQIVARLGRIFAFAQDQVPPGSTPGMKRPVFTKAHGCVRADFIVNPELPESLRIGVFKGSRYQAWLRFSNDGPPRPDQVGSARGMAIKLMPVPGKKILGGEEDALTQDFVMQNHPVFFADDAATFLEFIESAGDPERKKRFDEAHPETQRILNEIKDKIVLDPLGTQYWTPTPYKLGHHAIKYTVRPCVATPPTFDGLPDDPNFLQTSLKESLRNNDGCMKFYMQLQKDPRTMPLDRATVLWDPKESPYIHFADIRIPKGQNTTAPAREQLCENLSFTGWHSLPEHAPIGSLNLARKYVYKMISDRRRGSNMVPIAEPTEIKPEDL